MPKLQELILLWERIFGREINFFLSIMGFGEDETRTLKCIQNSDDLDKLSFALTAKAQNSTVLSHCYFEFTLKTDQNIHATT